METEYPLRPLRELCSSVRYGYTASATTAPTGALFVRGTDISSGEVDWNTVPFCEIDSAQQVKYSLEPGDIVVTRMGTIGDSAVIRRETNAVFASYLIRHRVDRGLADPFYVAYVLKSLWFKQFINSHGGGSVQPNINATVLGEFLVPCPPLKDQKAIARALGALDQKIELNRAMNHTLDKMASATFKSWFVDFDPVMAKAEGKEPFALSPEIASLFPSAMTDSVLGEVPQGWSLGRIGDICSTQYGYTSAATDAPVGPHLLRVTDINKLPWIEWENVPFCEASAEDLARYTLEVGDVLVSRMGDPGKAAMVEENVDAVFASYLVRLKAVSECSYYLFYFLRSAPYLEYADAVIGGTVQQNMNARVMTGAPLAVPPAALTKAFSDTVAPYRNQLTANVVQIRTLRKMRDMLLEGLLSGELHLRETADLPEASI